MVRVAFFRLGGHSDSRQRLPNNKTVLDVFEDVLGSRFLGCLHEVSFTEVFLSGPRVRA